MKSIFYVNGKFILTSDPMDRCPLVYTGPTNYFKTGLWMNIPVVPTNYWTVPARDIVDDIMCEYKELDYNRFWFPIGVSDKGQIIMRNWATEELKEFIKK